MEDRRNVGENSCNSGDGTDQTGPILDVYDDDDVLIKRVLLLNLLNIILNIVIKKSIVNFTKW